MRVECLSVNICHQHTCGPTQGRRLSWRSTAASDQGCISSTLSTENHTDEDRQRSFDAPAAASAKWTCHHVGTGMDSPTWTMGDLKNRSDLVLRPNRLSDWQITRSDRSSD